MSLGFAVLTYGRKQEHLPLLDGLLAADVASGDVLVIHNPIEPGDDWLPASLPGVAVRRMPNNGGYAAAMNAAMETLAADHDAVCLLTHDTRFGAGALRVLRQALEDAPDFGVLGPALEFQPGPPPRSFGGMPLADGSVGHRQEPPPLDGRGVGQVAWVDGCALILRTAAFRAAGPFDERYFMYFEETDLCLRVRAAGWSVGVVPAAIATSATGSSRRPAAYSYLFARNGLDWSRRWGGRRRAARFAASQARLAWRETPKPGGERFRDPARRRSGYAFAIGRLLGLAAGLAHRWGPPPARLRATALEHE